MRAAALIPLLFGLLGCPPADKDKKAAPPAATEGCARFGQTCELAPGKLGTCVARTSCDDPTPACLICQSQH